MELAESRFRSNVKLIACLLDELKLSLNVLVNQLLSGKNVREKVRMLPGEFTLLYLYPELKACLSYDRQAFCFLVKNIRHDLTGEYDFCLRRFGEAIITLR